MLLTSQEWEKLSPESRHRLNVFVKDATVLSYNVAVMLQAPSGDALPPDFDDRLRALVQSLTPLALGRGSSADEADDTGE